MKKLFIIHILLAMSLLAWCDNINFADAEVKTICVKNWDTNGDGELSYEEAAAVNSLKRVFQSNKKIKTFDEIQYFVNLKTIIYYDFWGCENLTSFIIPKSVTSVEHQAFSFCNSLRSITVQSSISFDYNVFYETKNLKEVHISDLETWLGSSFSYGASNPLSVGAHLYLNDIELTSIVIPETVKEINEGVFTGYKDLRSITIPNSVVTIASSAFSGCTGLTSLEIPNSVVTIASSAFSGCTGLTSITIPNSVTNLSGFSDCTGLTSITIPNSVTSIGSSAFEGCTGLTSITIPNSVTSIGSGAFSGCTGLTSITIPNSVTSIGKLAFSSCTGLTSLEIPNSVVTIGSRAFYRCSCLTNISLSNAITRIEDGTFGYCTSLANIVIPKSVKSIEYEAFYYCEGLKTISLGDSVTYIGNNVFGCCSSLSSVTIPNSVTSIGERAINCFWTRIVKVESTIPFSLNNSFVDAKYAILYVPKGCKEVYKGWGGFGKIIEMVSDDPIPFEDVKVKKICVSNWDVNGDGELSYNEALLVTSLNSLFRNNKEITKFDELLYFTNLEDIEEKAFSNCINLKSIKIPNTINTIGSYAFSGCEALTSILIPKNVKELGIKINKHYVNNIEIRDSVRTNPFSNCGSLCSIVVENGNKYYDSRDNCNAVIETNNNTLRTGCMYTNVPNSIVNIGNEAFQGCKGLVSLSFPNSLQDIGSYAFRDCINLDYLIFPNNITSIDEGAFQNCSKLTYLRVGNIINSLGNDVFNGCNNIAAIIWEGDSSMSNKVFNISNTNILFYTKDASYAPSTIKNVIVNGAAKEIVLSDANSSNNFYCPREFTAEKISYTHNYRMTSGLDGQARGWETIALPFTVGEITHESKGKLLPFGAWTSTSDAKPFWLCSLSSSGFIRATSIEANTPYIICMPNNSDYDSSFNLSGNVTFSATNVKVLVSSSGTTSKSNGKTFVPAFCAQDQASTVYALNVRNSYHSELGGYTEGSAFVSGLRKVSPFEAYMTTSAANAKRAFLIDFSETTGIDEVPTTDMKDGTHKIYNLNGQLVKQTNSQQEIDETLKQLPAGVYVVNGKKMIVK